MMNQEEWVEHFEAFNGRKPSPEEYVAALRNGEFTRDSKKAPSSSVSQTSPASKLLEASPVPSQAKQSFLGRLSKSAKIWIAVALVAVCAGIGGYAFHQYQQYQYRQATDITGAWELIGSETKWNRSSKWIKDDLGRSTLYHVIKNNSVDTVIIRNLTKRSPKDDDNVHYDVKKGIMKVEPSKKRMQVLGADAMPRSYEKKGDKLLVSYSTGKVEFRIHFRKLTTDEEKELLRKIEEHEKEY